MEPINDKLARKISTSENWECSGNKNWVNHYNDAIPYCLNSGAVSSWPEKCHGDGFLKTNFRKAEDFLQEYPLYDWDSYWSNRASEALKPSVDLLFTAIDRGPVFDVLKKFLSLSGFVNLNQDKVFQQKSVRFSDINREKRLLRRKRRAASELIKSYVNNSPEFEKFNAETQNSTEEKDLFRIKQFSERSSDIFSDFDFSADLFSWESVLTSVEFDRLNHDVLFEHEIYSSFVKDRIANIRFFRSTIKELVRWKGSLITSFIWVLTERLYIYPIDNEEAPQFARCFS